MLDPGTYWARNDPQDWVDLVWVGTGGGSTSRNWRAQWSGLVYKVEGSEELEVKIAARRFGPADQRSPCI